MPDPFTEGTRADWDQRQELWDCFVASGADPDGAVRVYWPYSSPSSPPGDWRGFFYPAGTLNCPGGPRQEGTRATPARYGRSKTARARLGWNRVTITRPLLGGATS